MFIYAKGGRGSGNFGHSGIPGQVGGSSISSGNMIKTFIRKSVNFSDLDDTDVGDISDKTQKQVFELMENSFDGVVFPEIIQNGLSNGEYHLEIEVSNTDYKFKINKGSETHLYIFREFENSYILNNSEFEIAPELQKSNLATQIYYGQEQAAMNSGIEKIHMYANNVGGYAWARIGYSALIQPNFDRNVTEQVNSIKNLSNVEKTEVLKNVIGKQPYEIATMSWNFGNVKLSGKDILLGSRWYGVKYLNENDIGYKVGQEYYRTKGIIG